MFNNFYNETRLILYSTKPFKLRTLRTNVQSVAVTYTVIAYVKHKRAHTCTWIPSMPASYGSTYIKEHHTG